MLDQRIEWLANLCQLEPVSVRVIRVLAETDAFVTIGDLVDRLRLPPAEVAIYATPRSPLRDWGLVRLASAPEPALKLNERIRRFLQSEPTPADQQAIALCRIQVVRRPVAKTAEHLSAQTDAIRGS